MAVLCRIINLADSARLGVVGCEGTRNTPARARSEPAADRITADKRCLPALQRAERLYWAVFTLLPS